MIGLTTAEETLWGIDVGGSKIEGVVISPNAGAETLCRIRIATEGDRGYAHVLGQIQRLVQQMADQVGEMPRCLGMGTPGSLDTATGLLRGSNSQHLNHKPIKRDLESLLDMPVTIENDANCFVLAETRMGIVKSIAPRAKVVFGIIMGTGVGGGLMVNNQLITGRQAIAGEWGHNFLDDAGGPCYCGRRGCVETLLSGPAIEKHYQSLTQEHRSLAKIMQLSSTGHPEAMATINRFLRHFGRGVASVINILDPDVIVIGGGVGNLDLLYSRGKEEIAHHVFNREMQTQIVRPELGDSAGVFGAAYLNHRRPSAAT